MFGVIKWNHIYYRLLGKYLDIIFKAHAEAYTYNQGLKIIRETKQIYEESGI